MKTKANDLYYTCIDVTPVNYDWTKGYAEAWEFFEATIRERDDNPVDRSGDEIDGKYAVNFDGYDSDRYTFDGPAMSYYYALPEYRGNPREDCKKIADLPLCIVGFTESGEHALALTGGGMDLSWEICEAFMRLGYLPPVHFCDLPQMSGRGSSARDRAIIAACRRALQGRKHRACSALRRLRQNFSPVRA